MSEDTMFKEAVQAIRDGQGERARDIFTRLLKINHDEPKYWLYMSAAVSTPKERIYCLQMVLRLDPENVAAKRGLIMMDALSPDEMQGKVISVQKRDWEVQLEGLTPPTKSGTLPNPIPKFALAAVLTIAVLLLVFSGITGMPFKIFNSPSPTQRILRTRTSTASFTAKIQSGSGTPVGLLTPTPLDILLGVKYTPTPLYINTPHPKSEAYRSGIRALATGKWDDAIKYMEQVVKENEDAVDALYYIGEAYRYKAFYPQAIDAYQQALKINDKFAPAFLGRARVRIAQNYYPEADRDLKQAILLDPEMGEAYLEKANYYLLISKPENALSELERAESKLPESPLVYLYRAQAYLAMGNIVEALANAQKSNQLDQTIVPTYMLLAKAYQASDRIGEAVEALQIYTMFNADDKEALILLGMAYLANKENAAAVDVFSKAIKLDRTKYEPFLYRGLIYLERGENTLALDDLSMAVKLNSRSFQAKIGLGRVYLATEKYGNAYMEIAGSRGLAKTDPDLATYYFYEALSLDGLGKSDLAIKDWKNLLALPADVVPADWASQARKRLMLPMATSTKTPTKTATPGSTVTLIP